MQRTRMRPGRLFFGGMLTLLFTVASLSGSNGRAEETSTDGFWMAIVGDSSTTGAATSPAIKADFKKLGQQALDAMTKGQGRPVSLTSKDFPDPDYFHITDPVQAPARIYPEDLKQQKATKFWDKFRLGTQKKITQQIDTEEFSFGYLIGRRFNLSPDQIFFAGKDGASIRSLAYQFHLIKKTKGSLPPLILVSYVVNDICSPKAMDESLGSYMDQFREKLAKQIRKIQNMEPAEGGTVVMVLAPLDLTDLVTNQELLSQTIDFQGHNLTCEQVRIGNAPGGALGKQMQHVLSEECRGILNPEALTSEKIDKLKALQQAQIDIWSQLISDLPKHDRGFQWYLAPSTHHIQFERGDLANDCFHPSKTGQARIAKDLLKNELSIYDQTLSKKPASDEGFKGN